VTAAPARRSESGFAIILALWAVGVVGLVGMGYVAAARARVTAASATSEHARLMLLAEGAAMRVAAGLVSDLASGRFDPSRRALDGTPTACAADAGVTAMVAVEDEAGKVNLNLSPPAMLAAALRVAGAGEDASAAIVSGILSRREQAAAVRPVQATVRADGGRREERRSIATQRAFASAYEIGSFARGDERLAAALLPLVTAHSNRPGIDRAVAPPALVAGLGGQDLPAAWLSSSERQSFTIRASVASGRAVARVDIVAAIAAPPAPPLRIVEWRRDPAPPPASGWPSPAGLPPC
jgi:general secretion pathway protein K